MSDQGWWERVPVWLQRGLFVTGAIGGPIGFLLGVRDLIGLEGPGWGQALAWSGAILLLLALAVVYVQQYRHADVIAGLTSQYRRNAAVALALPEIHLAFHQLRDAAVLIRGGNELAAYRLPLVQSLNHMAQAFSVVAGAPCRMSVKELLAAPNSPDEVDWDEDPRYLVVKTLYRHDGAESVVKDTPSPLYDNSDFRQVWDRNESARCFFSNDLDAHPGYRNPHREGRSADEPDYNAAIVWPVQKRQGAGSLDILGFLCVDAKQRGVFEYANDFDLGAAYADTLYTVLALSRDEPEPLADGAPVVSQ